MKKKRLIILSLLTALLGSVVSVQAQTCNPTAVTPYIKVAGIWAKTSTATINSGTQIVLGPQPTKGGLWAWSGCGTSGSAREQTLSPTASCTATTVYTNSCGAKTTQAFTVKVALYPSYNTNPIAPDATGMSSNAVQIASKIKLGINIGNTMEAIGGETNWGNPLVSAAYIMQIKDSGFDAIRLPVAWDQYSNQQTAEIRAEWLNRVKQVTQYAVDNGLYVIVNIHWDGGWLDANINAEKQAATNAKQKAFWEQIATKLRDFDEHVIFASANEPPVKTAEEMTILHSYHQTFVDAVRSTGGKNAYRVLVVQGPSTDIEVTNKLWQKMPDDTVSGRQMAEVHFYAPYNFALMDKDADWGKMSYYWGQGFHSTTDTERNATWGEEAWIDQVFNLMKTQFVDRGIPVVMGEFGAFSRDTELTGDGDALTLHRASRAYYYQYVTKKMLENGILPFVWEQGYARFQLFNRSTTTVADQQSLDALLVGAGKVVVLNSAPNTWTLSSGATNNSSATNMQFTLNQAWSSASYNFANPVNLSGATLKVVLNFDQAFIANRNGGADGFLQFFAYSANWAASEFKCWTDNKVLVAGQDTEFTCSAFGIQNTGGIGLQFPGTAGSVTIKKATIKLAQ